MEVRSVPSLRKCEWWQRCQQHKALTMVCHGKGRDSPKWRIGEGVVGAINNREGLLRGQLNVRWCHPKVMVQILKIPATPIGIRHVTFSSKSILSGQLKHMQSMKNSTSWKTSAKSQSTLSSSSDSFTRAVVYDADNHNRVESKLHRFNKISISFFGRVTRVTAVFRGSKQFLESMYGQSCAKKWGGGEESENSVKTVNFQIV